MLSFEPLADRPGLAVVDRLEQHRYRVHTPAAVDPEPISTDGFRFPVGEAVAFETEALVLPTVVGIYVRDENGEMVADVEHMESATLPEGTYILELLTQIKTYLEVHSPLDIESDMTQSRIDFGSPAEVRIGARSRHERPAATIETGSDPREVMEAVSAFGSALKTFDPERSYPTLRGHPPEVELGETLSIPEEVTVPETGIRIEIPPDFGSIFTVAPLSFYLGARLEPASSARIRTEDGTIHSLDSAHGFENEVARTLKQVFFLDCLTRTEGYTGVSLHERKAVDPLVDLDFASLYGSSLATQVEKYLSVPYEVLEEHIPEWRLTTHVAAEPDTVEQLPFVVDDLALIRTTGTKQDTTANAPAMKAEAGLGRDDVFTRSAGETPDVTNREYVQPEASDTVEQAWIGDSIPIGASKLTEEAFRNRLDREGLAGDIQITIVVNDQRMDEERDLVDQAYGDREELPFDVTVERGTTTPELRDLLQGRRGYLHYIGHTEPDGFECVDGKLDVGSLDDIALEAFFLNACNSYNQGLNLIEAGAIGGIVTLNDIINDGAVKIGESVARLLNAGFPLRASLTIARDESIQGGQYIVVGDGGMTVAQPASRTPNLLEIEDAGDEYSLQIQTYATDHAGLGSMYMPYLEENDEYFLSSGSVGPFTLSDGQLEHFLDLEEVPVLTADGLRWSTNLELVDF